MLLDVRRSSIARSMEPAFHRGDILFLHMGFTPFRAGDIVVFKVQDREIPIVHRVIKVRASLSATSFVFSELVSTLISGSVF